MNKTEIELINGEKAILVENDKLKALKSENYNFIFNKKDGFFCRWGKTQEDDGDFELGITEIADIELSTVCHGVGSPCKFCYKSNVGHKGDNMSLETFKKVYEKLPPSVTQIAAGIGDIDGNPDLFEIFKYCNDNGTSINVTINGARMTPEYYDNLKKYCGAVAVSVYDKSLSYDAIEQLTNRGMKQINIHFMISEETVDKAYEIMNDMKTDPRLSKMNAIVFLSLKKKGNAKSGFTQLSQDKFDKLSKYALDNNISFGFDSCSSFKFLHYVDSAKNLDEKQKDEIRQSIEPCESSIYSSYISCGSSTSNPKYYPCSFCEGVNDDWKDGIDVLECDNFLNDIWQNEKTVKFRKNLISCGRDCPIYKI